jgi:hypothetical protein
LKGVKVKLSILMVVDLSLKLIFDQNKISLTFQMKQVVDELKGGLKGMQI